MDIASIPVCVLLSHSHYLDTILLRGLPQLPYSTRSLSTAVPKSQSKSLSSASPLQSYKLPPTVNYMHMSSASSPLQATSYPPSTLLTQHKSTQKPNGKTSSRVALLPSPPNLVLRCSLTQQMTKVCAKIYSSLSLRKRSP